MQADKKTRSPMMLGTGKAYPASIPASIKGWDQISSLADMPPDHAVQLDNWIARPGYLEIRRGSTLQSGLTYAARLATLFGITKAGAPLMDVVGIGSPPVNDNGTGNQVEREGQAGERLGECGDTIRSRARLLGVDRDPRAANYAKVNGVVAHFVVSTFVSEMSEFELEAELNAQFPRGAELNALDGKSP